MATPADYTAVANALVKFFTNEAHTLPQFEQNFIPMEKIPAAAGATAKVAVDALDASRAKEKTTMTISPTVSAWINLILAILGVVAGATAALTTIFGQGPAEEIVSISGFAVAIISAVNGALHGISAPQAGPLVK